MLLGSVTPHLVAAPLMSFQLGLPAMVVLVKLPVLIVVCGCGFKAGRDSMTFSPFRSLLIRTLSLGGICTVMLLFLLDALSVLDWIFGKLA